MEPMTPERHARHMAILDEALNFKLLEVELIRCEREKAALQKRVYELESGSTGPRGPVPPIVPVPSQKPISPPAQEIVKKRDVLVGESVAQKKAKTKLTPEARRLEREMGPELRKAKMVQGVIRQQSGQGQVPVERPVKKSVKARKHAPPPPPPRPSTLPLHKMVTTTPEQQKRRAEEMSEFVVGQLSPEEKALQLGKMSDWARQKMERERARRERGAIGGLKPSGALKRSREQDIDERVKEEKLLEISAQINALGKKILDAPTLYRGDPSDLNRVITPSDLNEIRESVENAESEGYLSKSEAQQLNQYLEWIRELESTHFHWLKLQETVLMIIDRYRYDKANCDRLEQIITLAEQWKNYFTHLHRLGLGPNGPNGPKGWQIILPEWYRLSRPDYIMRIYFEQHLKVYAGLWRYFMDKKPEHAEQNAPELFYNSYTRDCGVENIQQLATILERIGEEMLRFLRSLHLEKQVMEWEIRLSELSSHLTELNRTLKKERGPTRQVTGEEEEEEIDYTGLY